MPFTRLKVTFGGLCMLVQQDRSGAPIGLFALMPPMTAMAHTPMLLVCDAGYAGGSLPAPVPLAGRDIDWRSLAQPGAAVNVPRLIPNYGKFAGGETVNVGRLQGALGQCLLTRVALPLGATISIDPRSEIGDVDVEYANDPTRRHPERVVGEATVEVAVTNPPPLPIDVGPDEQGRPVGLTPDRNGLIDIKIVSIVRSDLKLPCSIKRKSHSKGEEIRHVQAYYDLLENRCGSGRRGPGVFVGVEDPLASKNEESGPDGFGPEFVNPYQCTLGTGCPSTNPGC